jgi:glutathione S-transferase
MELYFSPLACSMATRIALYEAGADAKFIEVDPKTKQVLADGADYFTVNPLGLVPAIRTADGAIVTENAAILQHVAEHVWNEKLSPDEQIKLRQWLSFIGTEIHRGLLAPLLDPKIPIEARKYLVTKGQSRLDYLNRYLEGREFVLERFSVADAYLATVLNWTRAIPEIDLANWPAVKSYHAAMKQRPSIAKALTEELALYQAEQARHKAA